MKNNQLLIKESDGTIIEVDKIDGLTIKFFGEGNKVTVEKGAVFHNTQIKMKSNCKVFIGETHPRGIRNTLVDMTGSDRASLSIGSGTSIESARFAMVNENDLTVVLGNDCMLSSNIMFRVTDGHVIFDNNVKRIINRSKPIIIGNHVWIGSGVVILKGTKVLDNSIIGTMAVVSKKFEKQGIAIVGNPARVVRENINWDRCYIKNWEGS